MAEPEGPEGPQAPRGPAATPSPWPTPGAAWPTPQPPPGPGPQPPAGWGPPAPGWSQGPAGSPPPPPGWSQAPPSWSQGLPSWGQAVGAGGGYGPGRPTAGSSRTGPLPMYPMAVGDILDATFRLLRANAKALAPVLLLIAFPFEAIAAYNTRNAQSLNQVFANLGNPQQRQNATPSSVLIVGYLVILGIGLMTPVVAGFVCRTIAASYLGEQYRAGQVVKTSVGTIAALIISSLLVHFAELGAGIFCILPGLAVMALFVLTAPAIVIEGLGPVAGMRRSWKLVRPRFWPVLGTALLGGLMVLIMATIIAVVPEQIVGAIAGDHAKAVVDAIIGTITQAFQWSVAATMATLIYFNQRIRSEGLDLQVMAARLG